MKRSNFAKRLSAMFSSAILSGLALFQGTAYAQEKAPEKAPEAPPPATDTTWEQKSWEQPRSAPADRRGIDEKVDDFFAHKYSVHTTSKSIWIAPPQRFDIRLAPLPSDGLLQVTREYIELKPLRKEWYGRATGIEYGLTANIGNGYDIGGVDWDFRTGMNLGYYPSPEREGKKRLEVHENSRASVFVEGSRNFSFGDSTAYLITGVSFNRVSGNEIGRGTDTRVYTQMDFPALFSKPSVSGDSTSLGTFSGTVKGYAGTQTSGAQIGIYFNNLKSDGKGVNFSAGPEVHYDKRDGVSYRFKVRVSPKFW